MLLERGEDLLLAVRHFLRSEELIGIALSTLVKDTLIGGSDCWELGPDRGDLRCELACGSILDGRKANVCTKAYEGGIDRVFAGEVDALPHREGMSLELLGCQGSECVRRR